MITSLSNFEMGLVTDPAILLTKNKIIQQVTQMFAYLAEDYKKVIIQSDCKFEKLIESKISKGENYRGLPYLVLDYPRQFEKQDVCAIRTFFWWGNFFSITLHLSGKYQLRYEPLLIKAIESNSLDGWYLSCSETKWEHHFELDNYRPMKQQTSNFSNNLFIKIAKKIPLGEWDKAENFFKENFYFLINILTS